jgi:hypothetical protein
MTIKVLTAVLSLAATCTLAALTPVAFAETTTPPTTAEQPAAPIKPKPAPAREAAAKNVSIAEKAQKCLKMRDDGNGRLDCYDAAVKPQPNPNAASAKGIRDCRHFVDENQRLSCFDGFAAQIPLFTH